MRDNFESLEKKVVLMHSNDIHSRLENAARIASIIAEERRTWGADRVLAVDCGDHMDRMRQETEGSEGLVNVRLLQEAGYEAVTLGNNEGLTYTPEVLASLYGNVAEFGVICANMALSESGECPDWMSPSRVLRKNGLRIGLIGATANFCEFYELLGWKTTDPLEAIRVQAERLKDESDVIIVMSHLGIALDRTIAEEIPGIHLIVGGHTHHLLEEPLLVNGAMICAAGKFGDYVGRVEITWDEDASRPVLRGSCVPTGAFSGKEEAEACISSYRESSRLKLGRVAAVLKEPLPSNAAKENPLANLLAAGLRRWTNAEIGLVNAGQLLGGLAKGDVTAGELHAICPSPINPCRMSIRGSKLRTALEQSLMDSYIHKPIKGFGFRGEVLGTLAIDGMTVTYDMDRPDLDRIMQIVVNGEAFDDDRLYAVGSIDMFSFKVGYESLAEAESFQFYLPEFIRDVIERELDHSESLMSCRENRWHRR
ncbi:bifunctional UDP-sugar hydrolase/5'-nucleotidase [Paenibacillus sp. LHD-117]|uniref:bifunctional metallophosphatase/5'-nucleotidase n=1 Tax=Paenibacillus sp. LHD-117 TaxID=3071412 RepID=UPI0027DFD13E|nr:bifunctional UDP-sugar hydrolase/5'-nucleotidase [Paenibacillus sp. LHD-117]MDQ6418320.1 bifunctional UDP-sugar hydrolase/5'-nucleotidase [Paenibacillus sp. LHD-117]